MQLLIPKHEYEDKEALQLRLRSLIRKGEDSEILEFIRYLIRCTPIAEWLTPVLNMTQALDSYPYLRLKIWWILLSQNRVLPGCCVPIRYWSTLNQIYGHKSFDILHKWISPWKTTPSCRSCFNDSFNVCSNSTYEASHLLFAANGEPFDREVEPGFYFSPLQRRGIFQIRRIGSILCDRYCESCNPYLPQPP